MNDNHELRTPAMQRLETVVERLCHDESLSRVWHCPAKGAPMPSLMTLREIMDRLSAAIFPGYFGVEPVRESLRYHVAANLDSIYRLLSGQILCGKCFSCDGTHDGCEQCREDSRELALAFMDRLPHIRSLLAGDAQAAYEGDPAATSPGETIFCYPSMHAMLHHRIAHELYMLRVPLVPRIMSEMAHSHTGIDIHPGATILGRVTVGRGAVIGGNVWITNDVPVGARVAQERPR